MDRPAIVIRDIHHYGDDLAVPEAVARLRGGGQVTVTVTDPAPPGGDPRGCPRYGFDITVSPALGRQPAPPGLTWEARSFETPGRAALFAEALAWPASSPPAPAPPAARASSAARRRPAAPADRTTPSSPRPNASPFTEAERIARDRAARHPGTSTRRGEA